MTDRRSNDGKKGATQTGASRTDPPRDEQRRYAPECYACPIGTVFMTLHDARPETADHLIRAGREILAAMRSVLDGAWGYLDEIDRRRGAPPIERIPVRRDSRGDA